MLFCNKNDEIKLFSIKKKIKVFFGMKIFCKEDFIKSDVPENRKFLFFIVKNQQSVNDPEITSKPMIFLFLNRFWISYPDDANHDHDKVRFLMQEY